jgi:diguanylate cyclase (GGDEF)-like protein
VDFLSNIEKQSKTLTIFLGSVIIGVIGTLDFLTGYEIAFSLFYVIPIYFVTWYTGQWPGIIVSVVSAVVWLLADWASRHSYVHLFIPIWNTIVRLSFFVIITVLCSLLKSAMERERELARTDNLTGAVNSRFFYDLAQREIDRFQRYQHPFTLAYIDLDNFKIVNDQFGHATGDQALRTVVNFIRKHTRRPDMVARLGGDEFALLLPETNEAFAHMVLSKIQRGLLEEMQQNNWPITFSIGVLTCKASPPTVDKLVSMADELMYSVKNDGKNAVKYSIYEG